jgi:Asp-tRNA(Asn)/Glu-tRNA(Gln) amidotransferase A subunit family amidase
MPELTSLSAAAMAEGVRHRKFSASELVKAHLARIQKLNPQLNAFVQVDSEGVCRQARAADEAWSRTESPGPLHGVPISIKSSIEVKGLRAEWFNLLGTPAAVVPVDRSPEGLPIGAQVSAGPWQEELVLAVAEAVEKECGGWRAPPID